MKVCAKFGKKTLEIEADGAAGASAGGVAAAEVIARAAEGFQLSAESIKIVWKGRRMVEDARIPSGAVVKVIGSSRKVVDDAQNADENGLDGRIRNDLDAETPAVPSRTAGRKRVRRRRKLEYGFDRITCCEGVPRSDEALD